MAITPPREQPDPGTAEMSWHPAIETAIRDRPILREQLRNDGMLVAHLQLLSLFLHTLDGERFTQWEDLPGNLVGELLPSDRQLREAQAAQAAAIRDLERGLGVGFELLVQSGVATVVTPDEAAAGTDSDRPLAPLGWTRRCPECTAGKHGNCTGEALDDHDRLVPCACSSTLHPLDTAAMTAAPVMPTEHFGAEQVQCMKLGDPEHRGTHPQLSSCILPLAPSPGGWAQ